MMGQMEGLFLGRGETESNFQSCGIMGTTRRPLMHRIFWAEAFENSVPVKQMYTKDQMGTHLFNGGVTYVSQIQGWI